MFINIIFNINYFKRYISLLFFGMTIKDLNKGILLIDNIIDRYLQVQRYLKICGCRLLVGDKP